MDTDTELERALETYRDGLELVRRLRRLLDPDIRIATAEEVSALSEFLARADSLAHAVQERLAKDEVDAPKTTEQWIGLAQTTVAWAAVEAKNEEQFDAVGNGPPDTRRSDALARIEAELLGLLR